MKAGPTSLEARVSPLIVLLFVLEAHPDTNWGQRNSAVCCEVHGDKTGGWNDVQEKRKKEED